MQVILKVDGEVGLHSKVVEMDEDVVKHATNVVVDGVNFSKTNLNYNEQTKTWEAWFFHFVSKDDENFDVTGWTPEEGGYTEAVAKLKEMLDMSDDE